MPEQRESHSGALDQPAVARFLSVARPLGVRLEPVASDCWLASWETAGFAAAGHTLDEACRSFRGVLERAFQEPVTGLLGRVPAASRAEMLQDLALLLAETGAAGEA